MNPTELRQACAAKLNASVGHAATLKVFAGLDGFVDEILHAVDKRDGVESYSRIPTISKYAERLAAAAGKSTNIELVTQMIKLGGNGPIMANALASFGMKVTYLGALGYPAINPVFDAFCQRAEVVSIANPGYSDALEFEDGKVIQGKLSTLREMTWPNIEARFGREKFSKAFSESSLVAFVNWTMLPYMSEIWDSILAELCPRLTGPRRWIFFDLADPEKRTKNDMLRALDLIVKFEKHFNVILGLNEKESNELAQALGVPVKPSTPENVTATALEVARLVPVNTLVVHPVSYALAVSNGHASAVTGPYIPKPLITTGAGDHFNSGFCLGKLLGLDNSMSVLCGVATSGYYVRTAHSPSISELAGLMLDWPS